MFGVCVNGYGFSNGALKQFIIALQGATVLEDIGNVRCECGVVNCKFLFTPCGEFASLKSVNIF
jgi:hypothetical protein